MDLVQFWRLRAELINEIGLKRLLNEQNSDEGGFEIVNKEDCMEHSQDSSNDENIEELVSIVILIEWSSFNENCKCNISLYAPISLNVQTHSNNLLANCRRIVWRRIVWVCLTILWDWRLKGYNIKNAKWVGLCRKKFLIVFSVEHAVHINPAGLEGVIFALSSEKFY